MTEPTNDEIANILDRIAELLDVQGANRFRIQSYRRGAKTIRNYEQDIAKIVHEGYEDQLKSLPNIGSGLARVISRYIKTGRSQVLDRLEGEVSPEDLFSKVPGIGEELAERIVTQLEIHSLEELEQAAHDGRLADVEGFGDRRLENVRVSLAGMLSRSAQRRLVKSGKEEDEQSLPPVGQILDVDREYQEKAEKGELRKIAPKRFNPEGKAWLPILHTSRGNWDFTVLYSNTARAHELKKTHDWVVIYYDNDSQEGQNTVVTATHGPLEGKRVVRGREAESRDYYQK